jgi:hypothetical protein
MGAKNSMTTRDDFHFGGVVRCRSRVRMLAKSGVFASCFCLWLVLATGVAVAQNNLATADWPMDTLRLKDGRVLKGLLQSKRDGEVEFIEIVRPRGRPMYGVLYPIAPGEMQELISISDEDRRILSERFAEFRHRAVVEAGRLEALPLETVERERQAWYVYQGPWFTLDSTADEVTTRRCIVRIEQTFRAYRLILPPRTAERRNLRIVLHGSMDDYRTHLRTLGLDIANPAYFSVAHNEIVAGSDLSQYAGELARASAQSEATRREYLELDRSLAAKLKELSDEMQRRGFTKDEIKAELQARRNAWSSKLQKMEQKLAEIRRRNDARFAQVTQDMFRRLGHEAFHAYVENYVFPHDQGALPRWLNEGLAQIFEFGQLEADSLRVDAPDRSMVARLQSDLRGERPLSLRRLLAADGREFVKTHGTESTNRYYLYAWGLAWYLVFEFDLLQNQSLDAYAMASGDPVKQFEQLVGQSLEEFEPRWREAMLRLK